MLKDILSIFDYYIKLYLKFSSFIIFLLIIINFFFVYLPEYYDFPLTLTDPYTIYSYGLVITHNYVMWYIFLILIFVYWLFIQILRESIWNTFYKKIGFFSFLNTSDLFSNIEAMLIASYLYLWSIFFSFWKFISEFFFFNFFNKDFIEIYTWTEWVPDVFRSISDNFYLDFYNFFIHYNEEIHLSDYIYDLFLERKLLSIYANKLNNYYFYSKFMKRTLHLNLSFRHSGFLEFLFALFPSTIILLILIPSLNLLYSSEDTILEPEYTIKVIGHQWYWSYEFTHIIEENNENIKLSFDISQNIKAEGDLVEGDYRLLEVDNLIKLPISTPIRFLITSSDVLHSWSVPAFGIKLDAIPGRLNAINTLIFAPGTFYGQCSELCGVGHGFMPIKLQTVPLEDFKTFIGSYVVDSYKINNLNEIIVYLNNDIKIESFNNLTLLDSKNSGNFFFDVQDVLNFYLTFLFFDDGSVNDINHISSCPKNFSDIRPIVDIINLMWVRNALLRDVCIDSVLYENSKNNLELLYNTIKDNYIPFNYLFYPIGEFEKLPSLSNLNILINYLEKSICYDNRAFFDIKKFVSYIYKDITTYDYKLTRYLDSYKLPEFPVTHVPSYFSIQEYNSNYNNLLNLNSIKHININIVKDPYHFGKEDYWGSLIYEYSSTGQTLSVSFINCNYNKITILPNGEIKSNFISEEIRALVPKSSLIKPGGDSLNSDLIIKGSKDLIDIFHSNKLQIKALGFYKINVNDSTKIVNLEAVKVPAYNEEFIKSDLILHQKELLEEYDFYNNPKD